MRSTGGIDVVIPSLGRPSLRRLLEALAPQSDRLARIFVIDDRPGGDAPAVPAGVDVTVLRAPGRGPAAARNLGWRASSAEWLAFLDDDVVPARDWAERLLADLSDLPPAVAGSQGSIEVPLPPRRLTDWERNVASLSTARWITADIAFRRDALESVGGFDERFPRAYREDIDLAMRLLRSGWRIVPG